MRSPLPATSIHWELRVGTLRWPTSSTAVYAQSATAAAGRLEVPGVLCTAHYCVTDDDTTATTTTDNGG